MQQPDEHKRQRSTKEKLDKYGGNKRRLWNEYGPVKARTQYLCDILFAGDYHEMALAAGVCYRQLYRILYGHSRLSIRLAGQLVSRLGVRAEWLLCGAGSVFTWPEQADYFHYMPKLTSCYYTRNAVNVIPGTHFLPVPQSDREAVLSSTDVQRFEAAARSVFRARVHNKPVLFFLDDAAFTVSAPDIWRQFFSKKYANILMATLAGACHDLALVAETPPADINTVALTAATAGAGYGETFCRVAFREEEARNQSLLASVFHSGIPVWLSAEIGEIVNHTAPSAREPELGAAIGAAAYVDLLALAEQVPNFFGNPGGVVVVCGSPRRAVNAFLAQLPALTHTYPDQKGFVFILFQSPRHYDANLESDIIKHGGRVIYLLEPTVTAMTQLLQSCDDAYAGKLQTHD